MDDVFQFLATFKEFPPRSFPPSFVPATLMEETIDDLNNAADCVRQQGAAMRL